MRRNLVATTLLGFVGAVIPAAAADQNLFIVSIGDSLAAGEGNPDVPSSQSGHAGWLSASCHQSVNNGRRFASDRINSLDGVSTLFFNFACSGAQIGGAASFLGGGGLLKPQTTNQPNVNNFTVGAQIDRVRDLQTNTFHGRAIDILMISIGVNDINFNNVVEGCLVPLQIGSCTDTDAAQTAKNILNGDTMKNQFAELATAIRQKLNVKKVYITEYPNETSSSPGNFCGSNPLDLGDLSMANVSDTENQNMFNKLVVPLNKAVKDAVTAANQAPAQPNDKSHPTWVFVQGPVDTFATHGYCTTTHPAFARRYVNTAQDSLEVQGDQNGTMHPNKLGQEAYADALISQATKDFNLPLENPRILRRVEINANASSIPLSDSGPLNLQVEVGQHPGTLSVSVLHRIVDPTIPFLPPPAAHQFTATPMVEVGAGNLNLFTVTIPGYNALLGQTMEYKIVVTATRGGDTTSTTTQTRTIFIDEPLIQQ